MSALHNQLTYMGLQSTISLHSPALYLDIGMSTPDNRRGPGEAAAVPDRPITIEPGRGSSP